MNTVFEAPRFQPPRFDLKLEHKTPLTDTGLLRESIMVYMWTTDGDNFWFVPNYVSPRMVSGFREMYSEWVFTALLISDVKGFF